MKHYIDNSLKSFSDRIFLSYKNKKISFEEFYHNVTSKSRALLRLDLSSNNFVGIFLSNPIDVLEVYFACIQINVIPIIFPYDINSKELQVIIKDHKIDFIITEWLQKNQIKNIKDSSFFYIQELSQLVYLVPLIALETLNHFLQYLFEKILLKNYLLKLLILDVTMFCFQF